MGAWVWQAVAWAGVHGSVGAQVERKVGRLLLGWGKATARCLMSLSLPPLLGFVYP